MPAALRRLLQAALLTAAFAVPQTALAAPSAATTATPGFPLALFGPRATLPVASPTAAAMARTVAILINRDRGSRGLAPLRVDSRLTRTALERARWMAARNRLSHTSAHGSVLAAERYWRVPTTFAGECVGWTTAAWGSTAARWLYNQWKHSPEHWNLLMSSRFTRMGIGFGYRSSGGVTYGSITLARL
jgi:uncharacterized protein YkwD